MEEHRTLWQTAWGVVAGVAAAFEAGFVIALISSSVPFAPLVTAGIVLIVALYFVFAPVMGTWPFRSSNRDADNPPPSSAQPRRYGYIGRKGSKGDLSEARFSDKLDVGIDSAGEVDASRAEFGTPAEQPPENEETESGRE